jgi:mannose-6-phosphate isomerase-like protein (cupin superfamily)
MIAEFKPAIEFYTDERCYIVESTPARRMRVVRVCALNVAPGVAMAIHALRGIDERYVTLQGEGLVEVGDAAPAAVQFLDVGAITAGTSQRITNVGTVDLIILAVAHAASSR